MKLGTSTVHLTIYLIAKVEVQIHSVQFVQNDKFLVTQNQFGFMPGRSTMEAIFLIRQLMERYREQKKDLHMVFIDLEKAYDKVPRNVMWWALEKHKVPTKYITLIKDMYKNAMTFVRTCVATPLTFLLT